MDWAIAARAAKAYGTKPGQQLWGPFTMLRTMSAAVRSKTDFAMLALAVFNVCHCLRVGEAASIHKANISALGWLGFYDTKTKRQWVPARLGAWGERWRQALLACLFIQKRAKYLPLFSEAELEQRMQLLL